MTKRLDHYAHGIMAATRRDFKPQIVSKYEIQFCIQTQNLHTFLRFS